MKIVLRKCKSAPKNKKYSILFYFASKSCMSRFVFEVFEDGSHCA